jgi:hypothetical protein
VKRALHIVADHLAAMPDVRPQVLAVRFQYVQFTGLVAVGDQVLTEVSERADLTDRKLRSDHEPPGDLPGEWDFHGDAS